VVGFQTFLIALVADLVAINRRLLEEMKLSTLAAQLSDAESRARDRAEADR